MYLSGPVLNTLWSLSCLSTKYSKIARVSLDVDRSSASGDDHHNQNIPNGEIVVMVVDDGGDPTVGFDLQLLRSLVFLLVKIEVHGLVRQPKFFKNHGDFPVNQIGFRWP